MNITDDNSQPELTALLERFVLSFEKIAASLDGLNETYRKRFEKQFPERQARDAVISRVPTEEDRIREAQGASNTPIGEWLSELESAEDVGVREREWLDKNLTKEKERYARTQGDGES